MTTPDRDPGHGRRGALARGRTGRLPAQADRFRVSRPPFVCIELPSGTVIIKEARGVGAPRRPATHATLRREHKAYGKLDRRWPASPAVSGCCTIGYLVLEYIRRRLATGTGIRAYADSTAFYDQPA